MFAVSVFFVISVCYSVLQLMCMYVSVPKSTEPAAGGGITRPVDQHSAAAGSDPTCTQLRDVHHGRAHVFSYVL